MQEEFEKLKGRKVILESLSRRVKYYKDWAIVIVGKVDKPEFLDELKDVVQENEVASQVYFIDETPRYNILLSSSKNFNSSFFY